MFQFIGDAGARTLCHVYAYDVFMFNCVGLVVCSSCFDIINMACRDGFPYENLFSKAILLSHPGHISASNAQKLLIIFWHIFCLCAGSNHRNWLRICQTRDLYIRIHNLKLPWSRKFIGRRFMCLKVGLHGR